MRAASRARSLPCHKTDSVAGSGPPEGSTLAQVSFDGVTKRFGDTTAVDDLTLHVADGELLVLLGSSGCGKTTALRLVAGLEEVSGGTVSIGDRVVNDVDPKDRDVAMVFQSYALYPHLTVAKNIEFPLRQRGVDKEERRRQGEAGGRDARPRHAARPQAGQLSGGQRQRVALARAIVREPLVFLMDEPLSNLDAALRVQTRADIVELQARLATTTLYVTHDQVEAMTMGHRIAVMSEGRLQQVATPEDLYDRPANAFVAHFLGSPGMNLIEGMLVESGARRRPRRRGRPARHALRGLPRRLGAVAADGGRRRPRRRARRRAGPAARGVAPRPRRAHRRRASSSSSCSAPRPTSSATPRTTSPDHRAPGSRTRPSPAIGEAVRIAVDPDPSAFHLFDASAGVRLGRGRGVTTVTAPRGRSRRGRRGRTGRRSRPVRAGAAGSGAPAHSLRSRRRQEAALAYLLLVPAMAALRRLLLLSLLPQLQADALRDAPGARRCRRTTSGCSQIWPTISSTQFTQSLVTTLIFVVLVVPISLIARACARRRRPPQAQGHEPSTG